MTSSDPVQLATLLAVFAFGCLLATFSDGTALGAAIRPGSRAWLVALGGQLATQAVACCTIPVALAFEGSRAAGLVLCALLGVRAAAGFRLLRAGPPALAYGLNAALPWAGAAAVRLQSGALLTLSGGLFLGLLLVGQLRPAPRRPTLTRAK